MKKKEQKKSPINNIQLEQLSTKPNPFGILTHRLLEQSMQIRGNMRLFIFHNVISTKLKDWGR